jgi:3',5'-cyclic AMP phosphodiesterase CpdA
MGPWIAIGLLSGAWGVRTLPEGDGWAVRFEGGPAAVRVDGVARSANSPLLLDGAAHDVQVGDVAFHVEARPRDPCAPLRFVALGDSRAAVDGVGPSVYFAPLLGEALAYDPAFVVHTGDLVKNGRERAEWDHLLAKIPPWPPLIAVRGNHDRGPWFEALGLAPGPVYGVDLGPVFVAGVDTEAPDLASVAAGLDRLLAASTAPWKIVVMHRAPYSRGHHGGDDGGFDPLLVPVFDRRDVALVLSGHDHDYERFCPSRGVGPERHCADDGTTYVVTGAGGTFTTYWPGLNHVPAEKAAPDDAASRAFSGAQHFIVIEARPGRLEGTVHRARTGNVRPPGVIDTFAIERPVPAACR